MCEQVFLLVILSVSHKFHDLRGDKGGCVSIETGQYMSHLPNDALRS